MFWSARGHLQHLLALIVCLGCISSPGSGAKGGACPNRRCNCRRNGNTIDIRCNGLHGSFPTLDFVPGTDFGGLYLSDQNLTEVPPFSLQYVPVRTLDLSGNFFLNGIEANAFAGQELAMKVLALSGSSLALVPTDSLANLTYLGVLKLDANRISMLNARSFGYLPNLKQLHLYRNSISKVNAAAFQGLPKLEDLKLYENQISKLPKKLFRRMSSLISLDISKNNIQSIAPGTFKGLSSLKWLEMASNDLTSLNKRVFKGLPSLKYLKMEDNPLTKVAASTFTAIRRLSYLQLDIGSISHFHNNTFQGMTRVKTLNLGEVNRTHLPDGLFSPMKSLRYFYVSDYQEKLENISLSIFSPKVRYERLNIWVVPVHSCRCDVPWISELTQKGAYLQGYCGKGQPISCMKRDKIRMKEENIHKRMKRKKTRTSTN